MNINTTSLVKEGLDKAMSYEAYKILMEEQVAAGSNTGPEHTASLAEYTMLNDRRMKRWAKTFKMDETIQQALSKHDKKVSWLVLTESWCGDAAHATPIMDAFVKANPNIELKILLRDDNPELMDAFLTDGARSIPKLIAFDTETEKIIGDWGPRPKPATQLVKDFKAEYGTLTPEFKKDLQVWYNRDKGKAIAEDLLQLL